MNPLSIAEIKITTLGFSKFVKNPCKKAMPALNFCEVPSLLNVPEDEWFLGEEKSLYAS